jgi:taurine transport system ATP-binding protein
MQILLLDIWRKTGKMFFLITHDVDEAIFLATDLYVMSTAPGRIIKHFHVPFSEEAEHLNPRTVKAMPEFLELREKVLDLIWDYS